MPYKHYISHYSAIQKPFVHDNVTENFIKIIDANFSKSFDLKRIGVHHVVLPSGYRTSYPHAESLEEEFIYVISGSPQAWINGELYNLKPGCAVGFPAGTGVCHSFLNNSYVDVCLLVLGERTKKENKFIYPLNLELKESFAADWWNDWPLQNLGPHNGIPRPSSSSKPFSEANCIVDAPSIERKSTFSYQGDEHKETFGDGVRLTDMLGLKALGIWHERLMPGKRSSWPHAHKLEEEFAFILSGHPKIWLNGHTYEAKPGDGIYFEPGTNIAHAILNDTNEPTEYICVGEADDKQRKEKAIYPLHPDRNEYCREKDFLWVDPPTISNFGPHNGRP